MDSGGRGSGGQQPEAESTLTKGTALDGGNSLKLKHKYDDDGEQDLRSPGAKLQAGHGIILIGQPAQRCWS